MVDALTKTETPVTEPADSAVHAEVQRFYAHQMHLLDDGHAEDWARTFTDDGVFEVGTDAVRGAAGIARAARHTTDRFAADGIVRRHWIGMLAVTTVRRAGTVAAEENGAGDDSGPGEGNGPADRNGSGNDSGSGNENGPADEVVARSYALVLETPRGGDPVVRRSTVCTDTLVRADGVWRVRHRRVTRDGLD
ncbi:nuclear transport factor 2 family protein [Streptomyces sp. NPDC047928]|uniref:nuclear transport factor 2 family protein n=1 Tax=unclassified Streptomyces TaxID=2593676 RepID=UPI00371C4D4F